MNIHPSEHPLYDPDGNAYKAYREFITDSRILGKVVKSHMVWLYCYDLLAQCLNGEEYINRYKK